MKDKNVEQKLLTDEPPPSAFWNEHHEYWKTHCIACGKNPMDGYDLCKKCWDEMDKKFQNRK